METDYEELYRKETGITIEDEQYLSVDRFKLWAVQKMRYLELALSDRDKLLALAEARFRAGEELILEPSALPTEGFLDNELYVKDYILWQQSIAAYEAAVKGEGE